MRFRRLCIFGFVGAVAAVGAVALAQAVVVARADAFVVSTDTAPSKSVAIVLGAGLDSNGAPGPVLADRLQVALDLFRAGKVHRILVSGDNDGRGHDEVNPMREWLVERGVPSSSIYLDHAGLRTHDTMQRAARVFGVREALVCTQRFHVHRAVYLARSAGIDAVGVEAQENRWRAGVGAFTRETLARTRAVVDVAMGLGPAHLGEALPIDRVTATRTHDHGTRT